MICLEKSSFSVVISSDFRQNLCRVQMIWQMTGENVVGETEGGGGETKHLSSLE